MPSSSQLSPKVLAITLARGGSKAFPKNIIDVNGQPLSFILSEKLLILDSYLTILYLLIVLKYSQLQSHLGLLRLS